MSAAGGTVSAAGMQLILILVQRQSSGYKIRLYSPNAL